MENNTEVAAEITQATNAEVSRELPKIGWLRKHVQMLIIATGLALAGGAGATACTFDRSGLASDKDAGTDAGDADAIDGGDADADGGDGEVPTEICGNGEDDDDNGLIDCNDPVCVGYQDPAGWECNSTGGQIEWICDDGEDNDGDWAEDCDDPDCTGDPACAPTTETDCGNGVDDDNDGLIDCADTTDCAGYQDPAGWECDATGGQVEYICDDDIDNDGDGQPDCADSNCDGQMGNGGVCGTEDCGDDFDNDADGLVDCADTTDCTGYQDAAGWECDVTGGKIEYICDDTSDNDGDGFTDQVDRDCDDNSVCDLPCNAGDAPGDSCLTNCASPCRLGVCNEDLKCITPNESSCP